MSSNDHPINVRSINDLLAVVPYLIGYVPDHHLVIVGIDDATGRAEAAACAELLPPGSGGHAETAGFMRMKLVHTSVNAAYVFAYGDGRESTPLVDAVRTELADHGIDVRGALRIRDGRYWSYLAADHCPPEGTPIDVARSDTVMQAAAAGLAPFSSRTALAATIAPVEGYARAAMQAATAVAEDVVNGAYVIAPEQAARDHREASYRFLPWAADRYAHHRVIDDAQAAVLSVALRDERIRDRAVSLAAHGDTRAYVALWTDLARRVEPAYRVPVLCLLAFAAWRDGGGALPTVATTEALRADPHYAFAGLMRDLLAHGIHGPTFDVPKPGELADN
jgi:hypothetical protein